MDIERQGPKTTIEWCKQYFFHWNVAFLVVCVVAIAVDPIFFFLPVIKEATKCIAIDTTLKIIGICVRSFLDLIALGDLVARKKEYIKPPHMKCSDYVINILSILPVPQVIVPIIFSETKYYKSRHGRKVLNAVVLLHYVPRLFRIYRLWKIVKETIVLGAFWYFFSIQRETTCWQLACENDRCRTSFSCGESDSSLNFENYKLLNYSCNLETPNTTLFDFGIFQEARKSGILESMDFFRKTIYCFWWGLRNLSSFGQSLETSSDYWENCFAVLISIFGLLLFLYFIGNLQVYMQWETSKEMKEISEHKHDVTGSKEMEEISEHKHDEISKEHDEISKQTSKEQNEISKEHDEISKLLEVIYKEHDVISKLLEVISKEHDEISKEHNEISKLLEKSNLLETYKQTKLICSIESWISTIGLPDKLKQIIMSHTVNPLLQDDQKKDIDTKNPFSHLPTPLGRLIKLHLCLPLLRTVPIFKSESEELLYEITCKFIKQVQYNQNSYIVREGEPLDMMIFVVKGIVWTYTSIHGDKTGCLKKGDLFGRHLVEWALESPGLSDIPLSTRTLKCHTKVEAFCLMAGDLKDMISQCWWRFSKFNNIIKSDSEQLKHFAASSIQATWRCHAIYPKKILLSDTLAI
ncbi:hypothetical protein I3843_06G009000 [Carya illinoinensis]|nr:hypothetical protein I3843_06G009000 [Carya illinoinensis]